MKTIKCTVVFYFIYVQLSFNHFLTLFFTVYSAVVGGNVGMCLEKSVDTLVMRFAVSTA